MTPTPNDIGRIVRKRNNQGRRFAIVEVNGEQVTLQDLVFVGTPPVVVTDFETYEWTPSPQSNNKDE